MRRITSFLLLSLALGISGRALADDVADEADLKFRLGAEAYQRGDYRVALEEFLESNRLVPNRNVTYNVARCYQELKQYPEAYRYFSLALRDETNAETRARIEKELGAIKQNVAVLEVVSEPPGATVFIDRRDLGPRGNAPTALGLKPGQYVVLAELPGYYPARLEVPALALGESRKVSLKLEPILGRAVIGESARGATVRVDDAKAAPACTAPCKLDLTEGRHRLFFERAGFRSRELEVEIHAKQDSEVKAELAALTGSVVISTDEPGALIEIDDKPHGFTPLVLTLPVGQHRLRLGLAGFRTVARELQVDTAHETRVDVTLTQAEEVNAASRSTEGVEDAPSSVSIISSRELRAMHYPTITQALRGLPGVYTWDDRSYQAIGFRGLGRLGSYGNRVLVLVDGHPLNDDWLGSSYVGYDGRVGLEDVERIEVVRGPGSVLYGTGAFSGVINLVTRKATKTGGEVGFSTVESGVARGRARANVSMGPDSSFWASASVAHSNGRDFYFPELDQRSRSADGFDAGTLEGRYNKKWFSAAWYLQSHKKHLPTGEYDTLLGDPRTTQTDTRATLELKAEGQLTHLLRSMTRVHANHYRFDSGYARDEVDGGVEHDTFRGTWVGAEQRFEIQPSPELKLTLGGEGQIHYQVNQRAQDDTGDYFPTNDGSGVDKHPFNVGAAYALADVRPIERLHISAGARLDAYSTFGRSLNPRLAVVGQPYDGGNTKLMAGKAFRAPSVYELYYNDGGATQIAAPNLRPEDIYSLELEHGHRFSPTVQGTVAVFGNFARHLVTQIGAGDQTDPLQYVNAAAPIGTLGAELTLRRDWRQGYMLSVSYAFQRSRFLDGDSPTSLFSFKQAEGFRHVANSPEHIGSLKGALPLLGRALTLASRLTVESARWDRNENAGDDPQRKLDAFALWDVVLTGHEERYGFTWAAGVYNAFDWRYSLPTSPEFTQSRILQEGRTLLLSGEVAF